jgi:hypothetical protein
VEYVASIFIVEEHAKQQSSVMVYFLDPKDEGDTFLRNIRSL